MSAAEATSFPQLSTQYVPTLGSTQTATGLERFEFTIGDDVIPFFLGSDCFDAIAQEIINIGKIKTFDKLFIGCDETVEYVGVCVSSV